MKKFLSLALALIMALSLVTISAGATEYKDLTDKDEIQYEEAVAVLNKLGIITGYEDGSFRPEGELTRGAAAKIIVSLLIGSEAAEALPTTASPYPDVPANSTFAGVISFCKNEGIIAGYNDGTFRPTGTLTGYAFSKMLLGALGFDSEVEGFTGSGWTMRVATLGNTAGLFDRISFKGGETVNRETACQLALNTLKATTVEYNGSGSTSITIAGVPVDIGGTQKWSYRTSNQDFATNIKRDDSQGRNDNDRNRSDWYTVEFGEEHFVDLRLDRNQYNPIEDDFGRPCVQWSYKRVTIGKYPLEPDFSFSQQVIHALDDTSDASKLNALDMNGYKVTDATQFFVNGEVKSVNGNGKDLKNTAAIADYTDNGAQVYAYVSYKQNESDVLSHVVVIKSQLMEVKKIGSDYVSLQLYDNGTSDGNGQPVSGYNQLAINEKVADVEVGDAYYNLLKGMKVGDLVVVEPYTSDGSGKSNTFEVGRAYAPESVTGVFSHVQTHGTNSDNRKAIALTVGGTKYSISQWNKDLNTANEDTLKVTKKDVTLYLDQFGYPMLGKDIGSTTDWMIVGSFRQTMQNGYLVDIINGYDLDGAEIELNIGPAKNNSDMLKNIHEGDLVHYSSSTKNNADWDISMAPTDESGVYSVFTGDYTANGVTQPYALSTGNSRILLNNFPNNAATADLANQKGTMKYIFVTFDDDHEVSAVEILTAKQNVSNSDLKVTCEDGKGAHGAQACVKYDKDDGSRTVEAVVIKCESNNNDNLPIGQIDKYLEDITDTTKTAASVQNDGLNATNVQYANNRIIYRYTATLRNTDGTADRLVDVYSYTRLNDGDYFTWSKTEHETYGDFYTLHKIGDETTTRTRTVLNAQVWGRDAGDKNELIIGAYKFTGNVVNAYPNLATQKNFSSLNGGEWANIVNISQAIITDKSGNGIESVNDLNDWFKDTDNAGKYLNIRMLVNDNAGNDGFRYVYMMTIENEDATAPKTLAVPYVYADSIANKADSLSAPPLDVSSVPEADKYVLELPEGSWTEIVVNGETYHPGDELPTLVADSTIKVKPAEDYEIKDATLEDGYYTVEVSKESNTIKLTLKGSGDAEDGEEVALTGLDKMTKTAKATAVVYEDAIIPTVTFTAPDWAVLAGADMAGSDLDTPTFTYQIGNKAPATLTATGTTYSGNTATVELPKIELEAGQTVADVTINGTIAEWKKVVVEYQDDKGDPITVNTSSTVKTATASVTTTNSGDFNIGLPSNYTSAAPVSVDITGAKRADGSALPTVTAAKIESAAGQELVATGSAALQALGTGPVVVKFGAMTAAPITNWVISEDGGTPASTGVLTVATAIADGKFITTAPGSADAKLLVTVSVDGTDAAAGATVNVSKTATNLRLDLNVSYDTALNLGDGVASYNVHLALMNGSTEVYGRDVVVTTAKDYIDREGTGLDVSKITSDLTLKVTVTPVLMNRIESSRVISGNAGTVLVSFEKPVMADSATNPKNWDTANCTISKIENGDTTRAAGDTLSKVIITIGGITTDATTIAVAPANNAIECEDGSFVDDGKIITIGVTGKNLDSASATEGDIDDVAPPEGGTTPSEGREAVITITCTGLASAMSGKTLADGDKISITSSATDSSNNLAITVTYTLSTTSWAVTGTPTGYTGTFDATTGAVTLTASAVGAETRQASDFGNITVAVTDKDDSTHNSITGVSTGTLVITDAGEAATS